MPTPEGMEDLQQSDPERYGRLSRPHDNLTEMNKNIGDFFRELGVIREKYKIPDVLVAVAVNFHEGKPDNPAVAQVATAYASMQYGDSRLRAPLVLHLYRQEHAMIQALMGGISEAG